MVVDKKWSFNYEYDYYFYSDNKDYLGMVKIRNKKVFKYNRQNNCFV